MKRMKIIFILSIIFIVVYFTWSFIEIRNLQTDNVEKENVKKLAIKTIESIHLGDTEFLNTISETDKIKNILLERMAILKNSKYDNIEVMEIRAEKRNIYMVVVFFSSDIYNYLEYTFRFKKIDNKWMIVDFEIF
ncbi:MAG: hypothetical protein N4A64_02665 [Marinisporobacter sp.]|jgi:hypothetical protein|nr:hypothetical protein [Marinisporobacter sp.]